MSSLEELDGRVSAVRADLALVRQDIAATLASVARTRSEVAEYRAGLRVQRHLLNALRETQLEQGRMLIEQRRMLRAQDLALSGLEQTILRSDVGRDTRRGPLCVAPEPVGDLYGATLVHIIGQLERLIDRKSGSGRRSKGSSEPSCPPSSTDG